MIYRYFEASTTGDRFTPDISPTGIEDEGDEGDRGVEGDEGEKTSPPSPPSPSSLKAKRPTTYDHTPLPPLPTPRHTASVVSSPYPEERGFEHAIIGKVRLWNEKLGEC
jgi:hypothetical protein